MDLFRATRSGDIQSVRELLDRGADPNTIGYYGRTALFWASSQGRIEIVRLLLDRGADPNIRDNITDGNTALIYASRWGPTEIAKLLLDNGADPNITDDDGDTALMWAKRNKNYDVARLIRDHIGLQKARQRLAFATYLLGNDDDLDYDVATRIAEYVNDLDQYGSGKRRRKRKRKNYTRRRFF